MTSLEEINIASLGNVDVGKSTTLSILSNQKIKNFALTPDLSPFLDNGNGKVRSAMFNFKHEIATGRTSSVGHTFREIKNEHGTKYINFIDLAGHETFLKTTIHGLTTFQPDYALLFIYKHSNKDEQKVQASLGHTSLKHQGVKYTNMTEEHFKLLTEMEIPFSIVLTKMDIWPGEQKEKFLDKLKGFLGANKKKMFKIKGKEDLNSLHDMHNTPLIPIFEISNVTGQGLDLLWSHLLNIPRQPRIEKTHFVIDNVFHVPGLGKIVSGQGGHENWTVGQEIFIGPIQGQKVYKMADRFIKSKIRGIHDDYRQEMKSLLPQQRGCFWIKWDSPLRIRKGMIISAQSQPCVKSIWALLKVFHHTTGIRPGYQAFLHCGPLKCTVRFKEILTEKEYDEFKMGKRTSTPQEFIYQKKKKTLIPFVQPIRTGKKGVVKMEFFRGFERDVHVLEKNTWFFFREGQTKGIGRILDLEYETYS